MHQRIRDQNKNSQFRFAKFIKQEPKQMKNCIINQQACSEIKFNNNASPGRFNSFESKNQQQS